MKSIRVMGKVYKVTAFKDNGVTDENYGSCDEAKQEILVREDMAKDMRQDTLLHEVMHAVDYAMDTKLSEKQLSLMATGLLAVFKDNPEFLRYLAK